ncbi:MAG: CvpA family protein [candidate division WOR-3 bacterium]|nr:CvpA family protein [candidate division WOR-3 bacterium]
MCWVDIVILVIIMALMIHGLIVGFIRGIFDIAGIVVGIFLAIEYSERLKIPKYLAFVLIFLVSVIIISLTGRLFSRLIHLTPLGIMDRLMGGGLGFIKGIFFSFVFIIFLFLLNKGQAMERCEIAPLILKGGTSICQLLPEKWYKWLKKITKKQERLKAKYNYENYNLCIGLWQ